MLRNHKEEIISFMTFTNGETLYLTKSCKDVYRVWIEDEELYNTLIFSEAESTYFNYIHLSGEDNKLDNEDDFEQF